MKTWQKISFVFACIFLCANIFYGQVEYRLLDLDHKHEKQALIQSLKDLRMSENDMDANAIDAQIQELMSFSSRQSINGLMAIGAKLEEENKPQDALAIYEKITQIEFKYSPAHNAAASVLYQLGDRDNAIKHLKAAVKIEPNDYNAWFGLGTILEQNGDLDGAKHAYEKALYLNPYMEGAKRGLFKIEAQTKGLPM